jgi:imidazolonepropionase-like amidohydrolase
MKRVSALLLTLVLISGVLFAQTPPKETILIKAGRLVDVRNGRVLTDQAILIEGDRIKEVGPTQAVSSHAPANARVIDLSSSTVLPGLIDCHTHLTFDPSHNGYAALGISVPREALYGAKNAKVTLEAGFTTVRNVGASGYSDVALRDAIEAGDVPGPRINTAGPGIGVTGGHFDNSLLAPEFHFTSEGIADGVPAAIAKVREEVKYGADVIKISATGGVLSKGDSPEATQFSDEEIRVIVIEAHRLGRKVAAHAHGAAGIKQAVLAGVDSIEHGSFIDDEAIRRMK